MKIICGLGNPGKQYETTHHNMGFLAIDEIAGRLGVSVNKLKFKALLGETMLFGEKLLLVKPQTFMNNSGESLREVMNFYKAEPEDLFVIYDDIDLHTGDIRVRKSGSSGSHNGMKSVIYQLQYDDFPRCRIGIGDRGNVPLISHVLSQISDEEAPLIEAAVKKASDAALIWVQYGIKAAMDFANVSDETKKKNEKKKNSVFKTKRLIIRTMSLKEMRQFLEKGTGDAELSSFMETALKISEEGSDAGEDFKPLVIRLKDGGAEAGVIYKGEQGVLKPSYLPSYAEEIGDEVEDFLKEKTLP